jgi:hypothetical protein
MATSKSTVLGIRLDHERRAWIEAEAARRGLSVRGLVEEMIDGARTGEAADAAQAIAGLGSGAQARVGGPEPVGEPGDPKSTSIPRPSAAAQPESVNTATAPFETGPNRSSRPGLGLVTSLPGGLVRGACSLTAGLIEASARYGTTRLGYCPLVQRWAERSA